MTSMPENRKPQHRLDPRKPLVLDTRELGRRPGSMREMRLAVPAPGDLRVELIGVPAGADIDLDLRLESVMDGVLVSGTATAPLNGECGRCLETVTDTVTVDLQELFAYAPDAAAEDEVSLMSGDHLDLEPVLRDAVVLALPLTPLCDEDCAGLCVGCGERLDDLPQEHAHSDNSTQEN
ncbi:MAG TPA: YceD family protein [Mycobacteriales bacterium]|nr:YceD family protein [Mycobacteriales bacterium]